ncbi:hypothetical protein predicted by Glimmer/Critica [Lactiplantibacillus plantarum]|nr:hypothetical protein predicted by Glimmer/Critica [Lactiplantibacillus plantarum]
MDYAKMKKVTDGKDMVGSNYYKKKTTLVSKAIIGG